MAKVIYIKKPQVEIEFKNDKGEVIETFVFDKSDGAATRLESVVNGFLKEIAKSEIEPEAYTFDNLTVAFKPLIDRMLGDGAFERLYKLAGAWDILIYYFVQICVSIAEEVGDNFSAMDDLMAKYMNE